MSDCKRFKLDPYADSEPLNLSTNSPPQPEEQQIFRVGIHNFDKIVTTSTFVDKTMLIKQFLSKNFVLVTAPRGFGKSTNMDMLRRFFEKEVTRIVVEKKKKDGKKVLYEIRSDGEENSSDDDEDDRASRATVIASWRNEINTKRKFRIFERHNLQIYQDKEFFKEHAGKYPVVYCNFHFADGKCMSEILNDFRVIIHKLFRNYNYLISSELLNYNEKKFFKKIHGEKSYKRLTDEDILVSLRFLTHILYKHFKKKVMVFIDDIDIPINRLIFNKDAIDFKMCLEFIQKLIRTLFQNNENISHALLNANAGITGMALIPHDIWPFLFLGNHSYSKYYGLTNYEVDNLLNKLQSNQLERSNLKKWYNGYNVNGTEIQLHSSWSIINCLKHNKIAKYWNHPQSIESLRQIFRLDKFRQKFQKLFFDETITINYKIGVKHLINLKNIFKSPDFHTKDSDIELFIQFLYEHGFLSLVQKTENQMTAKIPNLELWEIFADLIFCPNYYIEKYNFCISDIEKLTTILEKLSLQTDDIQKVMNHFREAIKNLYSHNMILPEFQATLFAFIREKFKYVNSEIYIMKKNQLDIIVIKKSKVAIVIELNFKRNSCEIFNDILDIEYYKVLLNDYVVSKLILIGLHVDTDQNVQVDYLVDYYNDRGNTSR